MCFMSSPRPSVPAAPPAPPPSTQITAQDPSVIARQDAERRRRAAMLGRASTISTGPQGITMPTVVGGKSLLGG